MAVYRSRVQSNVNELCRSLVLPPSDRRMGVVIAGGVWDVWFQSKGVRSA